MEGIFRLLAVAVAGSVGYLVFWLRSQGRASSWREAAKAAGLTGIRVSTLLGIESELAGSAGPLAVTIRAYHRGKEEHGTRVVVGGLRHGAYALSIRPEGVTSSIEKTFGEREIELGDPAFDEAAFVQGAPGLIRAIFDAETRRLTRTLLGGTLRVDGPMGSKTLEKLRVSLSDDELRVDIRSSLFDSTEEWLPAMLPRLVALGSRLRRPDDLAARIGANIRGEALEEVRLANLRTLTSEFASHEATRDALLAALEDDSTAVRLHAAIALGPRGQEVLTGLAFGSAPDDVAAQAIAALGQACPVDRGIARLRQARDAGQEATATACIGVLGASGEAPAVEELIRTLASAQEALAAAAARALGKTGNAAAESPLIAALEHESGDVRVASAEALALVGTPLSVIPLREAASAHLLDAALRRAARQAVAEIQGRVRGASPGQLSLAGDQAGQVTLVEEDTRGRLSLGRTAQAQREAAGS